MSDKPNVAQSMPILVTRGDWKKLTRSLREVVIALNKADGKSDLPLLVTQAYQALAQIDLAMTPEARAEVLGKRILDQQAAEQGDAVDLEA